MKKTFSGPSGAQCKTLKTFDLEVRRLNQKVQQVQTQKLHSGFLKKIILTHSLKFHNMTVTQYMFRNGSSFLLLIRLSE